MTLSVGDQIGTCKILALIGDGRIPEHLREYVGRARCGQVLR